MPTIRVCCFFQRLGNGPSSSADDDFNPNESFGGSRGLGPQRSLRNGHHQMMHSSNNNNNNNLLKEMSAKMISQVNLSRLSNYCSYSMFSNESTESLNTASSSAAASPCSVRLARARSSQQLLNLNLQVSLQPIFFRKENLSF